MSINPETQYPGKVEQATPANPFGTARNITIPGDGTGTPWESAIQKDNWAFQHAMLINAGMEPNGNPDVADNSQLFEAAKASIGNGANLLSNHNFLIASPDDSQPPPDATPRSYPPGHQIFSGVFANETTGITNLTYIDGCVSFSGGDLYFAVPNTGGIERLSDFVASVADFDGKPRTRGVSFALVGDEYRVTVGIDALEDVSATLTPLGSVKFEQGTVATGHKIKSLFDIYGDPNITGVVNVKAFGAKLDGGDDSEAVRAAYSSMKDGFVFYVPSGDCAISADSDEDFILWGVNDARCVMDGYFTLLPNGEGYTPQNVINVVGNNNVMQVKMHNINNVPKKPSEELVENENTGLHLRGEGNVASKSKVFNFTVPYRTRGIANKIIGSAGTVTSLSNFGWPNDIITAFFAESAEIRNNIGAVYDQSNPRGVTFENNPLNQTSLCRIGIALDAESNNCVVDGNLIGEGFIVGAHSEGIGERDNKITNNTVHKQMRNSLVCAAGPLLVEGNKCLPVFNINTTGNPNLDGQVGSLTDNVVVKGNTLISDDASTICFFAFANKSPKIIGNIIHGDYDLICSASAGRVFEYSDNKHLSGSCNKVFNYSKSAEASNANRFIMNRNECRVLDIVGTASSGGKITASDNEIFLLEGYTAITSEGYWVISGSPSDSGQDKHLAKHVFSNNRVTYIGTTPITGLTSFVRSDATTTSPEAVFIGNLFDESVAFRLIDGAFVAPGSDYIAIGNSTDSIV